VAEAKLHIPEELARRTAEEAVLIKKKPVRGRGEAWETVDGIQVRRAGQFRFKISIVIHHSRVHQDAVPDVEVETLLDVRRFIQALPVLERREDERQ
jgi:hypothetical protein